MRTKKLLLPVNDSYWPHVFIALAQITFGVAWGSLFLPLDTSNLIVAFANLIISVILILWGHLVRRKK